MHVDHQPRVAPVDRAQRLTACARLAAVAIRGDVLDGSTVSPDGDLARSRFRRALLDDLELPFRRPQQMLDRTGLGAGLATRKPPSPGRCFD